MQKINYKKLLLKKNKEPITCLTAYSKPLANILDGNVDLILVGDSLGTTLYGMKNTRSVNIEMMKNHGKAVVTNTKKSMTIIDMPYKTYRNKKEALKNALDILNHTKADFIKIETDNKNVNIVKHLSKNKKGKIFNSLSEAYGYLSKIVHNNDLLMIKGSNATGLNNFTNNISFKNGRMNFKIWKTLAFAQIVAGGRCCRRVCRAGGKLSTWLPTVGLADEKLVYYE